MEALHEHIKKALSSGVTTVEMGPWWATIKLFLRKGNMILKIEELLIFLPFITFNQTGFHVNFEVFGASFYTPVGTCLGSMDTPFLLRRPRVFASQCPGT